MTHIAARVPDVISSGGAEKSLLVRIRRSAIDYLFLLPGLVVLGAFVVWPLVASQYFSLLNWSGFDDRRSFVGLRNYVELLADPFFLNAMGRSLLFTLVTVPVQMAISLFLAILLNNKFFKLSALFRTLIFLPVVTPVAVIAIVMALVLSPFNGPINIALLNAGLLNRPIDFLGDSALVLWTLAAIYVWKWTGVTLIYWLAALQTVPEDLYEAARLDGVRPWQFTLHVTLPIIAPFVAIIALITAIAALNVFPLVQATTGGGPYFASEVMEVFIFRTAFGTSPRLGYASAAGVLFGLAIMVLTIAQIVLFQRLRGRERAHG